MLLALAHNETELLLILKSFGEIKIGYIAIPSPVKIRHKGK